jgi:tRNA U34 2-thiouridine synthase MnmA/TrmU
MKKKRTKVAVGLSGGVDSSVAAALRGFAAQTGL